MKPNILIVGPSGSGKSTSLRNLDPLTTGIINIERKVLPFKQASSFKHTAYVNNSGDCLSKLIGFGTDPAIKTIILESFQSYDEEVLKLCRQTYKGYDIYSNHNKIVRDFISASKQYREKTVVFIALDEIVQLQQPEGGNSTVRRCKIQGKELEGTIEKEFTIVLFTDVRKSPTGGMKYQFQTNTDGITSAKTPLGMFDQAFIDNDLAEVIKKVEGYYV